MHRFVRKSPSGARRSLVRVDVWCQAPDDFQPGEVRSEARRRKGGSWALHGPSLTVAEGSNALEPEREVRDLAGHPPGPRMGGLSLARGRKGPACSGPKLSGVVDVAFVIALALVNGLLAMAEMAIISANPVRLANLAQAGRPGARTAQALRESPESFLATVQVGITLVGTLAAAFGGSAFSGALAVSLEPWLGGASRPAALALVVGGITFLNVVLGELVPKRLALHSPEKLACALAPGLKLLRRFFYPVVKVLSLASSLLLRIARIGPAGEKALSEEEVKLLIAQSTTAGVFQKAEQELVNRVLALGDRSIRRVMVPRSEVVWLDLEEPPEAALARIRARPHSRFPVCQGSLDRVVGVTRTRELLALTTTGVPLSELAQTVLPPLLFPEHLNSLEVLERFKTSGVHLGLVVDEHGSVLGLVTVNDIMEAIVGELADEVQSEPLMVQREDGSWLLDGALSLEEMFLLVKLPLPSDHPYDTVAGFVIHRLGRIPRSGEFFTFEGGRVEVMDMDGNRVDKVLLQKPQ